MKKINLLVNNFTKSRICKRKIWDQIQIFEDLHKCNILSLSISFIHDEEMTVLNQKHLKHKGSTDIITFSYDDDLTNLDGEIIICVDEAKRQARQYKVKLINELNRLVFHGLLHMIGYKDRSKEEKIRIHQAEDKLLNELEDHRL
ncbi:MAG: rRNA maturation RNase YbeY [Candidatus Delongbacteria bacterium]|nr:rRNA maturation RNase YbeY [Candidatus Delongbacteria bacterium]